MSTDRRFYSRAQVADTLTWIIATVVVILILGMFMFISSLMVKANETSKMIMSFFSSSKDSLDRDWISYKSSYAFKINYQDRDKIEVWLNGG